MPNPGELDDTPKLGELDGTGRDGLEGIPTGEGLERDSAPGGLEKASTAGGLDGFPTPGELVAGGEDGGTYEMTWSVADRSSSSSSTSIRCSSEGVDAARVSAVERELGAIAGGLPLSI